MQETSIPRQTMKGSSRRRPEGICSGIDPSNVLGEVVRLFRGEAAPDQTGELLLKVARLFLGAAYTPRPLEGGGAERLVVNLRGFDCLTFVETVLAFALLIQSQKRSFATFRRLLRRIRYRDGSINGYTSRLHYFLDWLRDNEKKGLLRDVTPEIGGQPTRKSLSFMTTHPELYPALRDRGSFRRMKAVERNLSRTPFFFLSKEALEDNEDRIRNGDIIALTTATEGLDVQHVGFAERRGGRVHLLHASRREKKVVLSQETLRRYLARRRTATGIIVARVPWDPDERPCIEKGQEHAESVERFLRLAEKDDGLQSPLTKSVRRQRRITSLHWGRVASQRLEPGESLDMARGNRNHGRCVEP